MKAMMPSAFGKWILVGLLAAAAVGSAEQPDDSPPSYLFFAKESKSPLITAAHPLHRAVAYYDLPGVKSAVEQGKADVNQAVSHKQETGSSVFSYTPMAVAVQSRRKCGYDCGYFPDALSNIMTYLLCAGANPNTKVAANGATPLEAAAQYNGDYALTYALLLSGASKSSATSAFSSNRCGYKQTEDQRAALTAALLLAFGADGSESKGMLQSAYTNREWKGGKCVKPDGGRAGASRFCFSTCKVLAEGVTAAEASDLRAGRVSPALATRLDLTPEFVVEANAALAKAAANLKACPAKKG